MGRIQLVEFDTSRPVDELRRVIDEWLDASGGKRTVEWAMIAADGDRPNHYWELLEFASEEEAAASFATPATQAAYQRWVALLDGEPVFHHLEVVHRFGGPSTG